MLPQEFQISVSFHLQTFVCGTSEVPAGTSEVPAEVPAAGTSTGTSDPASGTSAGTSDPGYLTIRNVGTRYSYSTTVGEMDSSNNFTSATHLEIF